MLQRSRVPKNAESRIFRYRTTDPHHASTEPRSEERGKLPIQRSTRRARPLQRSRVPKNAERIPTRSWVAAQRSRLQRSRVPKNAERTLQALGPRAPISLQRSRVPKNAESAEHDVIRSLLLIASTEPRSEERGKSLAGQTLGLPRGRFNGAAFRRTRKGKDYSHALSASNRFNGAAFRRTRKALSCGSHILRHDRLQRSRVPKNAESCKRDHDWAMWMVASTEPRSEERGKNPSAPCPASPLLASTEPRSEERGKRNHAEELERENAGFNGAAFRRTRKAAAGRAALSFDASFNGAAFRRTRKGTQSRGRLPEVRRLQRSRVPKNAERWILTLNDHPKIRLQRSRVPKNAESCS